MRAQLALLFSIACGCTCGETTISLHRPSGPIAVTATGYASLTAETCRDFFLDKKGHVGNPDRVCSSEGVTVTAASVDDPAIFTATPDRTAVALKALAAGTTILRADGDGARYETEVEARTADRIAVRVACDEGEISDGGFGPEVLYSAGAQFRLWSTAFAADAELTGVPDEPVRCDVAEAAQAGTVPVFVARASPARGTISSKWDSTLVIPARIFTPDEIAGEMATPTTEWGTGTATFRALALVDGRRPCVDTVLRRYAITTPDVCAFTDPTLGAPDAGPFFETDVPGPRGPVARRLKPGVCTVRAQFPLRPDLSLERSHTFQP